MKDAITATKLKLLKKIIDARLTTSELQAVVQKAKTIIKLRKEGKNNATYNLAD